MKKNLRLKWTFYLGLLYFVAMQTGFSQALLVENFNYTEGTFLTENNWIQQGSQTENPIQVSGEGLGYTGYAGSDVGNSAILVETGQDVFLGFPTQSSGSLYMAFLIKVTAATTTGDFFICLKESGTSNYRGRIFTKTDASDNLAIGLAKGAGTLIYSDFVYSLNTTYLVVLKYTLNPDAGDDVAELFINPVIGSGEPGPLLSVVDAGVSDKDLASVLLRQGDVGKGPALVVDGIRVTKTWEEALNKSIVATLSDLQVNAQTVAGFDPETYTYDVELPVGTSTVPPVTATTMDQYGSYTVTDAAGLPGSTVVTVTAEDGTTTQEYTILFTVAASLSDDASLSDLLVSGNSLTGFDPATLDYSVELPYGTTEVPEVTAVTSHANATTTITDAASLPGTTGILVTAEDGVTTQTYSVSFTLAAPSSDASLKALNYNGIGVSGFNPSVYNYNIEIPSSFAEVTVTATANHEGADLQITQASNLSGSEAERTATVVVTAEDGTTQLTYTIVFSYSEKMYHFMEPFNVNAPPSGWIANNIAWSSTHDYGLYSEGTSYAAKLKPTECFLITKPLNTVGEVDFYVKIRDNDPTHNVHLYIEKSYDLVDWTIIATDPCDMDYKDGYQNVNLLVNDLGSEVYIRFRGTATGGTADLGLLYIDDVAITKLEVAVDDATLTELLYNGITVPEFSPSSYSYAVEVPYYTIDMEITAVANNPAANINITPPANLRGTEAQRTATVLVTAEDGVTTLTYQIIFTVSEYIYKTGFDKTGSSVPPFEGWLTTNTYTHVESSIPIGNHGEFPGTGAFKFVCGKSATGSSSGTLTTAKYTNSHILTFWLFVELPDGAEKLLIEKRVGGGVKVTLADLTTNDMTGEWQKFTYTIDETDSTDIFFTSTLTIDGESRIWIDDLALTGIPGAISVVEPVQSIDILVYPNPAKDVLHIELNREQFHSFDLFNITGNKLFGGNVTQEVFEINLDKLPRGIYFITFRGEQNSQVKKFIKQ